jgi:hypothetical protein
VLHIWVTLMPPKHTNKRREDAYCEKRTCDRTRIDLAIHVDTYSRIEHVPNCDDSGGAPIRSFISQSTIMPQLVSGRKL